MWCTQVALELIKVVGGFGFESHKNCFFNLAIPVVVLTEPAAVKQTLIRYTHHIHALSHLHRIMGLSTNYDFIQTLWCSTRGRYSALLYTFHVTFLKKNLICQMRFPKLLLRHLCLLSQWWAQLWLHGLVVNMFASHAKDPSGKRKSSLTES